MGFLTFPTSNVTQCIVSCLVGIVVLVECSRYGMVFQSCIAAGDASDATEEEVEKIINLILNVRAINHLNKLSTDRKTY